MGLNYVMKCKATGGHQGTEMSDKDDWTCTSELETPPESEEARVTIYTTSDSNHFPAMGSPRRQARVRGYRNDSELVTLERKCDPAAKKTRGWQRLYIELRNRRVFRVAGAYLFGAWLSAQVLDLLCDGFSLPEWVLKSFLLAVIIGFPIFLALAWVYQMTSEGLKVHEDVDPRDEALFERHGLNFAIIAIVVVALGLLLVTRDLPSNESQPEQPSVTAFEVP